MASMAHLLPLLLAAHSAAGAATVAPSSIAIFSTVGHSEWCPAGTVYLDLRTGRYSLMPRAERSTCHKADVGRRIREGTLTAVQLRAVRKAQEAVQTEGMTLKACREGREPPNLVISNGGRVTLVVSGGTSTEAAPEELGCWTHAAEDLHNALERTFGYAH